MNEEPATRHFTPAELRSFLEELELAHPPTLADSGLLPLPYALSETARFDDVGRARPLRARSTSARFHAAPSPHAAVNAPAAERVQHARTRQPTSVAQERADVRPPHTDSEQRPRFLRRAFGGPLRAPALAFSACAGLLASLWGLSNARSSFVALLRAHTAASASTVAAARTLLPPPLPSPPALHAARRQTCDTPAAQVAPTAPSQRADSADEEAPGPAAARPRVLPTLDETLRREAVELLLSGRTRAALDAYRALPPAVRTPAVVEVVRYLERELETCAARAGTSCGSR